MINLIGNALYQWDVDRKVKILNKDIVQLSFSNDHHCDSNVCGCDGDGVVTIPNHLLQSAQDIDVYGIDAEGKTIYSCVLSINSKSKPDDYNIPVGGGTGGDTAGGFITEFIEDMSGFTVDGQHFETSLDLMNDVFVISDEDFAKLWQICQNKILIYRSLGAFPAELLSCDIESWDGDGNPNKIMFHTASSMSMTICTEAGKSNW